MARVWRSSGTLGDAEVARGIGGAVSPVLAGFSLAAIATLLTSAANERPEFAEPAVAAFTLCAVLLLGAMQFAFSSLRYSVSPAARLEWHPEATTSLAALDKARQAHNEDYVLATAYAQRFRLLYNLGLLAFVTGLALLTFPADWKPAQIVAFGIAVCAGFLELLWIGKIGGFKKPHLFPPLLPERSHAKADVGEVSTLTRRQAETILGADGSPNGTPRRYTVTLKRE
jgi:hypothetical protein